MPNFRPPLRYIGSKSTIADWIAAMLPPQHEHYVEPFGGGACVLLVKGRSPLETYGDLNYDVVRFFRVLRERPRALVRALELTPWARTEFELSCADLAGLDDLEHARRYVVRSWMSLGMSAEPKKSDWRYEVGQPAWQPSARLWSRAGAFAHLLEHAERLRGVQLEHADAFEIMRRFDRLETLFYLDPPYLADTIKSAKGRAAYGTTWDAAQHTEFLDRVLGLKGLVAISGYSHQLYADRLEARGWSRADKAKHTGSRRNDTRVESVWMNPRAVERIAGRLF